jgi:hypothetical protein
MIARYRPLDAFTGNVKSARDTFREVHGFPHDDKIKVDKTIMELFDRARFASAKEVTIPIKLVLALILRKGFYREANRPPKKGFERRKLESAISNAWRLIDKYQAEGLPKAKAKARAIKEAAAAETDSVPESVLRDQMGRPKYRHLRLPEATADPK